jgi:hypothetical protein
MNERQGVERLNLTLTIPSTTVGDRQVNVRSSLQVASLISTVQDKFNLDGRYEIRLTDGFGPLPPEAPLSEIGVKDGMTLVITRVVEATGTADAIRRGAREPFSKTLQKVYFVENRTLTEYPLKWHPAVLGRRDHKNPANNRLLAVDLEEIEDLPTVSRHHAAVLERGGSFFIEGLQERNPVILDGQRLKPGIQYPLAAGATVQLGRVALTFRLVS